MEEMRAILVDEASELFDRTGMFYKKFPSDFRQIRYFTLLILQKAPAGDEGNQPPGAADQRADQERREARQPQGPRQECPRVVRVRRVERPGHRAGRGGGLPADWRNGTSSTGGETTASSARISRRWRSSSPTSPRTAMIMTAATPCSPPWSTGTRGWSSTTKKNCVAAAKRFPHKRHGIALAS